MRKQCANEAAGMARAQLGLVPRSEKLKLASHIMGFLGPHVVIIRDAFRVGQCPVQRNHPYHQKQAGTAGHEKGGTGMSIPNH